MSRSRAGPILLAIALSIVAVVLLVPGTCNTTAGDVEARINDELPIGSSEQDVENWITEEGTSVLSQGLVAEYSALRDAGLSPDLSVVHTSIKAGREDLVSDRIIDVYFIMNSGGELVDVVVRQVSTGL